MFIIKTQEEYNVRLKLNKILFNAIRKSQTSPISNIRNCFYLYHLQIQINKETAGQAF